jgi:two-component system cell cycle sensor histidine kinase/response regulator CckA
LANLGYRVTAAAEPAEALQLLGDDVQIDLLVTDMVMPTMNGRQLAAKLRAARPELRVVYISGYTDDAVIASGAIDIRATYLPKPFEVEQLAQKIRELLDA